MQRRAFLSTLTGAALAPVAVAKAITSVRQPTTAVITTFGCTFNVQAERYARYILILDILDKAADDRTHPDYYTVQWYDPRTGRFLRTEPILQHLS